jgi:hypothetical protein
MANKISLSPASSSAFVDITSRYIDSKVLQYGDNNVLTFESYKRKDPVFNKSDKFYLITASTAYRPDLVSNLAYGQTSFWWKIMEANRMKDISEFKAGVTIRIPQSI